MAAPEYFEKGGYYFHSERARARLEGSQKPCPPRRDSWSRVVLYVSIILVVGIFTLVNTRFEGPEDTATVSDWSVSLRAFTDGQSNFAELNLTRIGNAAGPIASGEIALSSRDGRRSQSDPALSDFQPQELPAVPGQSMALRMVLPLGEGVVRVALRVGRDIAYLRAVPRNRE